MKLKFKYTERYVTIFITAAGTLLLLVIMVLILESKLFTASLRYKTTFTDALGLSKTTPITFKGYNIGGISSFSLNKENNINVDIYIYEEFSNIVVQNSSLYKTINPVTQSALVELFPGESGSEFLPEDSFLQSINVSTADSIYSSMKIQRSGEIIYALIYNLNSLVSSLNKRTADEEFLLTAALEKLADASVKLSFMAVEVRNSFIKIEDQFSDKGSNINTLLTSLSNLSDTLTNTTAYINEATSNLNKFIKIYSNPDELLVRMIDPTKDELINPASLALRNLDSTLAQHKDLAKYLNSKGSDISELISETNKAVLELQKTIKALNNNPFINANDSNQKTPFENSFRRKHE